MKRPLRGCLWTLGVLLGIFLLILILDSAVPSKAVRDLPDEATEVEEYYKDFGMTGDFKRLLKARIPEHQLAEYARKVGATDKLEVGVERDDISWTGGISWFSPNAPPKYIHREQGYRILIGWEDGFLYFEAIAW